MSMSDSIKGNRRRRWLWACAIFALLLVALLTTGWWTADVYGVPAVQQHVEREMAITFKTLDVRPAPEGYPRSFNVHAARRTGPFMITIHVERWIEPLNAGSYDITYLWLFGWIRELHVEADWQS